MPRHHNTIPSIVVGKASDHTLWGIESFHWIDPQKRRPFIQGSRSHLDHTHCLFSEQPLTLCATCPESGLPPPLSASSAELYATSVITPSSLAHVFPRAHAAPRPALALSWLPSQPPLASRRATRWNGLGSEGGSCMSSCHSSYAATEVDLDDSLYFLVFKTANRPGHRVHAKSGTLRPDHIREVYCHA